MSVDTNPTIRRHSEVCAVLADPRFAVPAVPAGDRGLAWLRAHVARFSTGADHQRRRGLAADALVRVSPAALSREAHDRTVAVLAGSAGGPVDLMAQVARPVPLGVLAEALGVTDPVAADVAVVAGAYLQGVPEGPAADGAVARLVGSFGGVPDEATAARIGLLVQACDAVAGLIGNCVLAAGDGWHRVPAGAIVVETLRYGAPVASA